MDKKVEQISSKSKENDSWDQDDFCWSQRQEEAKKFDRLPGNQRGIKPGLFSKRLPFLTRFTKEQRTKISDIQKQGILCSQKHFQILSRSFFVVLPPLDPIPFHFIFISE